MNVKCQYGIDIYLFYQRRTSFWNQATSLGTRLSKKLKQFVQVYFRFKKSIPQKSRFPHI
jgi:hypothetical protein